MARSTTREARARHQAADPAPVDRPGQQGARHPEAGHGGVEVGALDHRREAISAPPPAPGRPAGAADAGDGGRRTPRSRSAVHATITSHDEHQRELGARSCRAVEVQDHRVDQDDHPDDDEGPEEPVLDSGPCRVTGRRRRTGQDAFLSPGHRLAGLVVLRVVGGRRLGRLASPAAPWPPRRSPVLGPAGVHVDVLLAGEPHDLVHDLVGDRPQHEAVVLEALVAREVQRLAEAHTGSDHRAELLAGRRDHVGAEHRDRDHRHLGLQREPRHAGLAAVEPAVVGPGALGVDPEQLSLARGSGAPTTARPRPPRRRSGRSAPGRRRRRTCAGTSPSSPGW